jgi:hypothetical protein
MFYVGSGHPVNLVDESYACVPSSNEHCKAHAMGYGLV